MGMLRKRFCAGAFAAALVFGFAALGCDAGGDGDNWAKVTGISEIRGSWKGSSSIDVPEITIDPNLMQSLISAYAPSLAPLPGLPIIPNKFLKSKIEYAVDDLTIRDDGTAAYEVTIDGKKYLEGALEKAQANIVWALIPTLLPTDGMPDGINVTFPANDADKVKIAGSSGLPEDADIFGAEEVGIFINQKGNKLKVVADIPPDIGGMLDGFVDIDLNAVKIKDLILNKK